jgi:hypothetical protein
MSFNIEAVSTGNYRGLGMIVRFLLLIFFTNAASPLAVRAQVFPTAVREDWFDKITGIENSGIINGPEYRMNMLGASSNPFLEARAIDGLIRYNDQVFHVPLLYDIYQDVIIVKHLSRSGAVWLIRPDKTLVQEFVISNRLFRNFDRGFHQVLFENTNFSLVSKRSMITQVKKGVLNYIEADRFFILQNGRWKSVWSKGSFLKMLASKEDKKRLKMFINQNKIKVRKFKDEDLVKVAMFFSTLSRKN